MNSKSKTQSFLHPKYWPTWLALGILYSLAHLPVRWQLAIGKKLGKLTYHLLKSRRRIGEINLARCFPELTENERTILLKKNFESVGLAIIETAIAWWWPEKKFDHRSSVTGLEHLQKALEKKQGVILLCAHFTNLEICGRLGNRWYPVHTVYRPQKNPLFNFIMEKSRGRNVTKLIDRRDVRGMVKSLKANQAIYYAADQDYGPKYSIFVPFFGIPAATVSGILKLAKVSGATVLPVAHYRDEDDFKYRFVIHPALENFPSDNAEQDLQQMNHLIEKMIREKPEQYLWIHRRFKTRPPGEARWY